MLNILLVLSPVLLLLIANLLAGLFPKNPLVRCLWGTIGPMTDVHHMTRQELFGAARYFLVAGVTFFLVALFVAWFLGLGSPSEQRYEDITFFLYFTAVIFCFMGIGGGSYLLIRAVFRRKRIDQEIHAMRAGKNAT